MDPIFIISSMAWNTGLVGIAAYMVKRWMDKQETTVAQNKTEVNTLISNLKRETRADAQDLNQTLNGIFNQLRIANGRTGKLEGRLDTQIAICEERNK